MDTARIMDKSIIQSFAHYSCRGVVLGYMESTSVFMPQQKYYTSVTRRYTLLITFLFFFWRALAFNISIDLHCTF